MKEFVNVKRNPNLYENEREADYKEIISFEMRYYHSEDYQKMQNEIQRLNNAYKKKIKDSLNNLNTNKNKI